MEGRVLVLRFLPHCRSCWYFLFGFCFLTPFSLLGQHVHSEPHTCTQMVAERATDACNWTCQCSPYCLLPPPPPPPPPPSAPRHPALTDTESTVKLWGWKAMIISTVVCGSLASLLVMAVICYKTFIRKLIWNAEGNGIHLSDITSPPGITQ
ncbi:proline-rich membrane anchor 1 isoform X1 [Arapaima gigas]